MHINHGRFLPNGGSGYILKPEFQRSLSSQFDPSTLSKGPWLKKKTFNVMVRVILQLNQKDRSHHSKERAATKADCCVASRRRCCTWTRCKDDSQQLSILARRCLLFLFPFVVVLWHISFCFPKQKVISAQQLPKINKDKHKSIVDPLVRVEIYGVPADNASKETHHIDNNGERNAHTDTQMWTRTHTHTANVTRWTIISPCRVQPDVEWAVCVWRPLPGAGHAAVCGGGLWLNIPEWSHRAVLSPDHQRTER